MAGTKAGSVKSVRTIKRKHGDRFFSIIGAIGGSRKVAKGFAGRHEDARVQAHIGGLKSKRGFTLLIETSGQRVYQHKQTGRTRVYRKTVSGIWEWIKD